MATPEDPATAMKGESLWWFWIKEPIKSNIAVWKRDARRIKQRYGEDVTFWKILLLNKQTKLTALHLFMSWVIIHYLGWQSFRYQIIYNLWSSYMLQGANYVEHYGLQRLKDKNGIYESITRMHSWNAISSPIYFRLQRHSDHHCSSFRPYQVLRRYDDVPFYPFQFASCFWTVWLPPLWFYCMDPRVDAIRDLQLGKKGNKSCWTNHMPLTEHDIKIKKIVWVWMSCLTAFFGYMTICTNLLYVY